MSCVDNKHKYSLWEINESDGLACRTCKNCGNEEKFLADDFHFQEIKKQKEADLFFKAFNKADNHDENIIGYLNVILDDYINYLEDTKLNILINKMEELENSSVIDVQNSMFLKNFGQSLKTSNFDDFLDCLDSFQEYNASYFATILNPEEVNGRHL